MHSRYLALGLGLLACGGTVTYGDGDEGAESDSADDGDRESGLGDDCDAPDVDVSAPAPGGCDANFDWFDEPTSCEQSCGIVVTATHYSPTDGCSWSLTCDGSFELVVECDGENDGTNTSLCGCLVDGEFAKDAGRVPGEGVDACMAGYKNCIDPLCAR
jgi:hypothetical protein